jgi:hypothetical protein
VVVGGVGEGKKTSGPRRCPPARGWTVGFPLPSPLLGMGLFGLKLA